MNTNTLSTQTQFPMRWIVSPRYDLFFFMGSCVFTFMFWGVYQVAHHFKLIMGGNSILITYFFFTAIFDHPHIFQTFSRTHLDGEEFRQRRFLHTWGLVLFIVVGLLISLAGYENELILFAAIFGSYHIIRQHYGFLKAYKNLHRDTQKYDNQLDFGVFYLGMIACFFNDYTGQENKGYITIYGNIKAWFPNLPDFLPELIWGVFLVVLALWLARQAWLLVVGEPINLPKMMFLSCALGTHYFIFFATATPFLVAEALETAYHDIQYQGWMMHYQQKRFPTIKKIALKWFAVSLAYGLIVGILEIYGLYYQNKVLMLLFVPFTMVVIYHYYVDGLVWKFGKNPELRKLIFEQGGK
ncbi:MAG: hypothetical protein NW226_05580 [Microscillaceae bacterium]|nr:hypothetical protein [Microscillaceae bacterium]